MQTWYHCDGMKKGIRKDITIFKIPDRKKNLPHISSKKELWTAFHGYMKCSIYSGYFCCSKPNILSSLKHKRVTVFSLFFSIHTMKVRGPKHQNFTEQTKTALQNILFCFPQKEDKHVCNDMMWVNDKVTHFKKWNTWTISLN